MASSRLSRELEEKLDQLYRKWATPYGSRSTKMAWKRDFRDFARTAKVECECPFCGMVADKVKDDGE